MKAFVYKFNLFVLMLSSSLISTSMLWVPVSSTGKISDSWIKDLGFNFYLHQKPISVLVWW